jgi:ArsR family transcriptional regulator
MPINGVVEPIYDLQASVLRTLAHPRRLEMLHALADGPLEVSRIAQRLRISQPNASQHLALLRQAGLVEIERNGREVRYALADPEVMTACSIMRSFLQRRIERLSTAAIATDGRAPAGAQA